MAELPYQDLLLFTPLNPEADSPYGVSLLRSLPFLADILMKIYHATGVNWERCGNVRFAVTCRNGDGTGAAEKGRVLAEEWSRAMRDGDAVRDFVAVGDVDIRVIGGDAPILDSQVPVRQITEQIVAKTGIPPFMLGLSWNSTERMSSQQADMLTTEITAIRRTLTPTVERICRLWLRMHGYTAKASKSSKNVEAFGESEPVATIEGQKKYTLELTRLYATDDAVSDGINFYELKDFSLVICKPDRKIIYSGCEWSAIQEEGQLNAMVAEKVTVVASKRIETGA